MKNIWANKTKLFSMGLAGTFFMTQNKVDNFFGFFSSSKEKQNDTFVWGNGQYQARPEELMQFKNFIPHKLKGSSQNGKYNEEIPNLKCVKWNQDFGFGIDDKGKLWVFENRKIDSFVEKISENYTKVKKDNLLNELKRLSKNDCQKIVLTEKYLWMLDRKGNLHSLLLTPLKQQSLKEDWRQIKTLKNLQQIEAGDNHLLLLTKEGQVYSMGDDTMGQCGLGSLDRSQGGPFIETKVPNPELIESIKNYQIERIFAKGKNSWAISKNKDLFGWGSNEYLQLAHELEHSVKSNPKLAFYEPQNFNNYLKDVDCDLQDLALGDRFTIVVCKNQRNKQTELFGTGFNMNGQLGNGYIKHINNFQKIDSLSNHQYQMDDGKKKNVEVKKIECGKDHCMALMDVGALLVWGGNEYGQLGNKKRSFSENPLISSRFKNRKVVDFFADYFNNMVMVEKINEKKE